MQHRLNNIPTYIMLDGHVTVTICVKKLDRKLAPRRRRKVSFEGVRSNNWIMRFIPYYPSLREKGRETEEG